MNRLLPIAALALLIMVAPAKSARAQQAPGEVASDSRKSPSAALAFHNRDMKRVAEPGRYRVWVSGDSATGQPVEFEVE